MTESSCVIISDVVTYNIYCMNSICYQVTDSNFQEDNSEPEDSEDEYYGSLYQQSSGGGILVWEYSVCKAQIFFRCFINMYMDF